MNDGKTPKKPIKKEDNSKDSKKDHSKQTNNVIVQKESCTTKAKPNLHVETRSDESIDNDLFKRETCESKAKTNKQEKPSQNQVVIQKETCTKLSPKNLQNQKPCFDFRTIAKESDREDLITPNGIKTPAQKSGTIKKTPKTLPVYQILPQDKNITKKDGIQTKNFPFEAVGYDKLKKTITIQPNKYPAAAKLQSTDNQEMAPSQANKSDIQRYLLSKMANLPGLSIQRHELPEKIDNIEPKLEPALINAKETDCGRKQVYIKDMTQIDQSKDINLLQDQYPTQIGANQLKNRDLGRKHDCSLKESTKKLDPREHGREVQYEKKKIDITALTTNKDGTGVKDLREEVHKSKELNKVESIHFKIRDLTEDQLKKLGIDFPEFMRNQYRELEFYIGPANKIIIVPEPEIEKLHDLSATDAMTTDNKPEIKIDDLTEEQLKLIELAFADFIRDQYNKMHADFEASDEQLQLEHEKETASCKIEKVPEILYKGTYKLQTIPENLPKCYKLFDLSKDFETVDEEIESLHTEVAELIPDPPVVVETDYIEPRKGGCIPECGQVPVSKRVMTREKLEPAEKIKFYSTTLKMLPEDYAQSSTTISEMKGSLIESYYIDEEPELQRSTIRRRSEEIQESSIVIPEKEGILIESYYIDEDMKLQTVRFRKLSEDFPESYKIIPEVEGTITESHYIEKEPEIHVAAIRRLSVELPEITIPIPVIEGIIIKSYYIEEPTYYMATITQLEELTTKPEFGITFEPQQGVLIERFDNLQGASYSAPPKYHIAKDATLAEYDYIYEMIDKEKKIKKTEVQIARRKKLQEKPQFSQYIEQDKRTGENHKSTVTKRQEEIPEQSKEMLLKVYEINELSVEKNLKSEKLAEEKAINVESHYKYDKPIIKEPTYEKAEKRKIPQEIPEYKQLKTDGKRFEILTKRMLSSEKYEEVRTKPDRNAALIMESHYKYEKPIIKEPTYEKVTKSIVHKELPEYCQKIAGANEFKILEKRKLSPEKYDEIQIQPGKEHVFRDSFYKYEKPIVEKPIYDKITKSKIYTELPDYSQKETDNKEFELSTRRKLSSEKYEKVRTEPERNAASMDSHYKYEKPIIKKPTYEKVTKSIVHKELPEYCQKLAGANEFKILGKRKLSPEKYDEIQIQPGKEHVFRDSFYKYEKPIVEKPIYDKITKSKIYTELPDYSQKKTDNKEFELSTRRKLSSEKYEKVRTEPERNAAIMDSHYKYEKPIIKKPTYEKVTKSIVHKELPEYCQKIAGANEFKILEKRKLSPEKYDEIQIQPGKEHVFRDSFYKYEKPIVEKPIYDKITKSKIYTELPDYSQKETDNKEFELSTRRKLSSEKYEKVRTEPERNAASMDSHYKYEKPIIKKPTYEKVTKSIVHKELPEYCQKLAGANEFKILGKRKLSPEKYDEIQIQPGKEHVFRDSFYKYEKPIVEKPIYDKITKSKIYTELPDYSQKKTDNKEFELSTRRKLSSEKYEKVRTEPERNAAIMDSHYKYEKPIIKKPTYEKVTKSIVHKELPEYCQKIAGANEFKILEKRKLSPEKYDEIQIQPGKENVFRNSFYKYEKPIVEKPIYDKITKSKIYTELPDYSQKKTDNKEFELSTRRKLSSETYEKVRTEPERNAALVDSHYKYEKPIIKEPIYQKVTKSIVHKDLPEDYQKKAGANEFEILEKRKLSPEKYDEIQIQPGKEHVFRDSFYKYEKPIYDKITKSKIYTELPDYSQKKTDNKEFELSTRRKLSSEKYEKVRTEPERNAASMDSHYKYEKPIIKKPTYEKVTKSIVHKELPEYCQKIAGANEFKILEKRKVIPEKYDKVQIKPEKKHIFLDSFYKYEKATVEVPIYKKIVKSILSKGLPDYSQKKIAKKEFAISTKKKETGIKSDDLHTQTKIDATFVDSSYKYEKPIIDKPTYKTAKMLLIKSPYQKQESSIKLKETKLNRVDSDYKYEKPTYEEKVPIMEKLIRTILPSEKPIQPVGKTKEDKFKWVLSEFTYSKAKTKADVPSLIPVFDILKRTILPSERPEFATILKQFPFNLLYSDYNYKPPEKETRKETYGTAEASTFSTKKPEQPLQLKETVFKQVHSDYKYEKLPGTEKEIVIPIYHVTTIADIPIDIPESCQKIKENHISWVDSHYNFVKPVEKTSCNEIKYAHISKLPPTKPVISKLNIVTDSIIKSKLPSEKPVPIEKTKEKEFLFVDSEYKYGKPTEEFVDKKKLLLKKIDLKQLERDKPDFAIQIRGKEVVLVDSIYKYEKPVKHEEHEPMKVGTADIKHISASKPEAKTKIKQYKHRLTDSEAEDKKLKPILLEKMIVTKGQEPSNTSKMKNPEIHFVDSVYRYEKRKDLPVIIEPVFEKATVTKTQEASDQTTKTKTKPEAQYVHSRYKYEKSKEDHEDKSLVMDKVTVTKVKDIPGNKTKMTGIPAQYTDSDYKYEVSKEKEEAKKPVFQRPLITKTQEIQDQKSTIKEKRDAQYVDSDYKYEKSKKLDRKIAEPILIEKAAFSKSEEKPLQSDTIRKPENLFVDSNYIYEKSKDDKRIKESVIDRSTLTKILEVPYERTKTKSKLGSQYVDSHYKYEKPEPRVLEQAAAIMSKDTSAKLKAKSEKDAAHYTDSDYVYEKLKDKQLVSEPEIQKAIISKVQAASNQIHDIAIPKSQYKDKSIVQKLDSTYRYEKSIQEKERLVFAKATFIKDRDTPECKLKPKETDAAHFVDSEYEYEPPLKTAILEPIKIQTATRTAHIDEPEYNVMINEHDAIWMNFIYTYEKIRPDLLEKYKLIPQINPLIEKPERKPTYTDVYQAATKKKTPATKPPTTNVIKVPEFQIIPESFEESEPPAGPSTAFPMIQSKKSSSWPSTKKKKKPHITCPNCNNQTDLKKTAENTVYTHLIAITLVPLMLCFVPYVLNSTRKVIYRCAFCNTTIMKPEKKQK